MGIDINPASCKWGSAFIIADRLGFVAPHAQKNGALDGVTRDIILELTREWGVACSETTLSPYDLYTADECFLTGTAVELIPVHEVDGRKLPSCPGHVFRYLQQAFRSKIQSETGYVAHKRAMEL